jgi:hypothetical protein
MIDIEKMSHDIFDEMRLIIGQNRISEEAFLSTIARGLHAAVAEEREAILKIAKDEKAEAPVSYGDFNSGYLSALEFMMRRVSARSEEEK